MAQKWQYSRRYNRIVDKWFFPLKSSLFQMPKRRHQQMKCCPYCGTVLVDGAVSFWVECGKRLQTNFSE